MLRRSGYPHVVMAAARAGRGRVDLRVTHESMRHGCELCGKCFYVTTGGGESCITFGCLRADFTAARF